ncbi:hypothetical protein, partial [Actinomadura sp. 6K520]|uniref:hypothetical protein n=1 Tax=Actinomadura sp. 6K520 TaxID=2530364 RepID=UPI0010D90504
DAVAVVEPADIIAAGPRGLNRLYVALTRAVTSLHVLHSQPLPEPLRQSTGGRPKSPPRRHAAPDRIAGRKMASLSDEMDHPSRQGRPEA